MTRKTPVKLVMQYRDQGFSRNMIAKTQKWVAQLVKSSNGQMS